MPFIVIAALLVIAVIVAPQFWVKRVMREHSDDRPDLPGTGGELAHHLLREFEVTGVRVQKSTLPPHYDPRTRTINLDAETYDGRSISAVAVTSSLMR